MIDLTFLKALRDKLRGGNVRSIHLNALPGRYATRLDLANLNLIQKDFAEEFLELLLTKQSFRLDVSFDNIDLNSISNDVQKGLGLLSKRLNSIYIENEDNFKEQGIKTFGFGFPILIKPSKLDPTKIIKAPLFIWQLEIIKSYNKVNTWSILRNKARNDAGKITDQEIHSVGLNDVLLSFMKTDENILIPQINEDLLEDAIISKDELLEECYKVLNKLNVVVDRESFYAKFNEPIIDIPDTKNIEAVIGNNPWIYVGGVFGLFRTQKESIITDIDKLIEDYDKFKFDDLEIENFSGTPYSAVETDPSQQEILNSLGLDPKKIIQGPPGTGKSQSLTAIITNALANNLKCLVVCEKKTALDVIKNNLHRENDQLGALVAVIEDINKDRDGIVTSVRDRINSIGKGINFNETTYNNAKQAIEETAGILNEQHKQLDKKIYQGKSWTELVGEYLKREKTNGHSILKTKLDYKAFLFEKDENELSGIIEKIIVAQRLYKEINRLDHPLEILRDEVFKEKNPRAIQLKLEDMVGAIERNLIALRSNIESEINLYKEWLDGHYFDYYEKIKNQVNRYKDFSKSNYNQFGDLFLKNDGYSKFVIGTFSVVSSKYKSLKENKNLIISHVEAIKQIHLSLKYFDHSYPQIENVSTFKIYDENIEKLNQLNDNWYKTTDLVKDNFLQKASSDFLHPKYTDATKKLPLFEQQYDSIISSARNLIKRVIPQAENLIDKLSQIDLLISDVKAISKNLENFHEYYSWRNFYINLSQLEQNVIRTIIQTDCKDWVSTFECWYYYWLLVTNESENLLKSSDKIEELFVKKEQLQKNQIKSIIHNWSLKQYQSIKEMVGKGLNPTSLFNKKGSKGERRNSLRKIINSDFQFFTNFFPVIMISPTACSSVIPLHEGLFDIIIFDEASQLRVEDTFPALIRGKIKIVSGDNQQMPPSNFFMGGTAILNPTDEEINEDENLLLDTKTTMGKINNSIDLADSESLLVYAENCNYKQSQLKIHYRSHHPHLIDFSNHAFYGKSLIPMPPKKEYKSIRFIDVEGLYEDQINKDEAKQVVNILLNHIKPFNDGRYPSVGVATLNLYQRNLILEEIIKARQQKPEYDKIINDLGPDFFVKNLENIQGDERDIIIISTTFGKRKDGSFRQQFGPILQRNGYKLLNVIITRAKYKIFVCSSIPQEYIKQYSTLLQQNKNTGRGLFYSYLAYAKAVSDGDVEIREAILRQLYENCDSKSHDITDIDGSESPFEEEVYYRLAKTIGQKRVQQQYKIGGFRIDMVIKSENSGNPVIAIECDGAKYHSSNEAYAWDMFRQKQIEQYGFKFYRIWSTNWFYSSEKELRKMISFIQDFDRNERKENIEIVDDFYTEDKITPVAIGSE